MVKYTVIVYNGTAHTIESPKFDTYGEAEDFIIDEGQKYYGDESAGDDNFDAFWFNSYIKSLVI